MPSSRLCLIMMVGLFSRMQAVINPFMSYGFDGCTTLRPGMWQSSASRDWLCCAAAESPAPPPVVIVSGIVAAPPNMYFSLAAWLTIWSNATHRKSMNMMSTIGRKPGDCRADAEADDGLLADRGVDHPAFAELGLEPGIGLEHAAEGADVLAGAEHVVIEPPSPGERPR